MGDMNGLVCNGLTESQIRERKYLRPTYARNFSEAVDDCCRVWPRKICGVRGGALLDVVGGIFEDKVSVGLLRV